MVSDSSKLNINDAFVFPIILKYKYVHFFLIVTGL